MFVVTVLFEIKKDVVESFQRAMLIQAQASLERERNCLQFDVCFDPDAPEKTFLYEVYGDETDFQAHLQSPHFQEFDRTTRSWIVEKIVQTWQRAETGT